MDNKTKEIFFERIKKNIKRTREYKPHTLEDTCGKGFFSTKRIEGRIYCLLGISKKIRCNRQAKFKDINGFYLCLNLVNYDKKDINNV